MKIKQHILFISTMLTATLATGVSAQQDDVNPYMQEDDTWVSINGTVQNVTRDSFELDYGEGAVIVEMDDGDRDADAYKLLAGDRVTVNGMIDDDFLETTSIEASSIYVEKLDTYFYASSLDEEDHVVWYSSPVLPGQVTIQGTVTAVNDEEFTVNSAARSIDVNTDELAYNPLDEEGYQKIDTGDQVRVTGRMDEELFDNDELNAHNVITLVE